MDVSTIGGAQGIDVPAARVACRHQIIARAPAESIGANLSEELIGHEPSMPAVAVGEGMDEHELMVEAAGCFFERHGAVIQPVLHVQEQLLTQVA
jgi:hypothetical protein